MYPENSEFKLSLQVCTCMRTIEGWKPKHYRWYTKKYTFTTHFNRVAYLPRELFIDFLVQLLLVFLSTRFNVCYLRYIDHYNYCNLIFAFSNSATDGTTRSFTSLY